MTSAQRIAPSFPPIPAKDLPAWAEWLYAYGNDTFEIAEILGIPEADVCRMLTPRPGEIREAWAVEEER